MKRGITPLFRIKVIDLEKTEVLRELADVFFTKDQYLMETVSREEYESSKEQGEAEDTIIINKNCDLDIEGAKRELYQILSVKFETYPKWGTLTGVRPVKLAGEQIQTLGKEKAIRRLKDYYLISQEKIDSIVSIYEHQINSIGPGEENSISIYIGIPFCPTRCLYCSFASNQVGAEEIDRYLSALYREIEAVASIIKDKGYSVESLYIGGGTPTTLSSRQLEKFLTKVEEELPTKCLKEFSLEAGRPDTIDREKLNIIKSAGVDRISINPQSMISKTLRLIGREHEPEDIIRAIEEARDTGFNTINCDLIAGLPEENPEDMDFSLSSILDLGPENITIHSLAVKKASRLIEQDPEFHYKRWRTTEIMLEASDQKLKDAGYIPYYLYRQKHMAGAGENTGYALAGHESIYNIRIMDEHQTILAMGAGGISKIYHPENNRLERVPNVTNYEIYIDRIDEMIERKRKVLK